MNFLNKKIVLISLLAFVISGCKSSDSEVDSDSSSAPALTIDMLSPSTVSGSGLLTISGACSDEAGAITITCPNASPSLVNIACSSGVYSTTCSYPAGINISSETITSLQNGVSDSGVISVDTSLPPGPITVDITSVESVETYHNLIPMTVTFNQDVSGFTLSDIAVVNGIATNLTGGPSVYTFGIDSDPASTVTIDIAAGLVTGTVSSEANEAANQFSIDFLGVPFVSEWTVAAGDTLSMPYGSGAFSHSIDYGDGSPVVYVTSATDANASHTYPVAGTYTVTIKGLAESFNFNDGSNADPADREKITSVINLGDTDWKDLSNAFYECVSLTGFAGGVTDNVTSMVNMFRGATSVNPDVTTFNTSNVNSMAGMFAFASAANPNTSNWDTSGVVSMASMFEGANVANPDTSGLGWNTINVTDMSNMFKDASMANPVVDSWDVSFVEDMSALFKGAVSAAPEVISWQVGAVTNMNSLFEGATSASPSVINWDMSGVVSMSSMFKDTVVADPDTSLWTLGSATDMSDIFSGATGLSNFNYSNFIVSVEGTNSTPGLSFSSVSQYQSGAATARASLISNGWVITDGGAE